MTDDPQLHFEVKTTFTLPTSKQYHVKTKAVSVPSAPGKPPQRGLLAWNAQGPKTFLHLFVYSNNTFTERLSFRNYLGAVVDAYVLPDNPITIIVNTTAGKVYCIIYDQTKSHGLDSSQRIRVVQLNITGPSIRSSIAVVGTTLFVVSPLSRNA